MTPRDIDWLLNQAGIGEDSNRDDLSRELQTFTLTELCGLVYHCRLYNPVLWVTTDEEADQADLRWMTLEAATRTELSRKGVPTVPYEPEFREQLDAYAAFLKRMAAITEHSPDAELNDIRYRGILVTGLVVIFTRDGDDHDSYWHLSLSALDRVPSQHEIDAAVEAFFGNGWGVRELQGLSGDRIRHFVKDG